MIRSDKEIKDKNEIIAILKKANWCQLAMYDGKRPYVIPLNYGYFDNSLYIHCATKGLKLDILKKNPEVAFNVTIDSEYMPEELSMRYRSVNGFGKAVIIDDEDGKREALNRLTGHFGAEPVNHSSKSLKTIKMIRVDIEEMTGKKSYV